MVNGIYFKSIFVHVSSQEVEVLRAVTMKSIVMYYIVRGKKCLSMERFNNPHFTKLVTYFLSKGKLILVLNFDEDFLIFPWKYQLNRLIWNLWKGGTLYYMWCPMHTKSKVELLSYEESTP